MNTFQNEMPYVCVVKDGAGVGRVMPCEARSSVLGTMQALIPKKGVNRDYLLHLIRSLKLGEGFSGSTIPHIYFKDYGKRIVPDYSSAQQTKIASVFSLIESLKEQRSKTLGKLDQLIKSRFVEMFGDPNEGEYKYEPEAISALCESFVGGGTPSMKHPEYYGGTIPFIKSGDLKYRAVAEGSLTLTEEGLKNSSAKLLPTNSVMVVTRSGILKHTLPVAINTCPVAINQDIKALILKETVLAKYVQYALLVSEPHFLSKVRATTADNIETRMLKEFTIPLPPIEIQQGFVGFVSQVDKSRFVGIEH